MFHLRKCGFDGFTERSCAAGKPNVQHGTYRNCAAILSSVVNAKPAVTVFFCVFVWAAVSAAAPLTAAGWPLHNCLHTVERRGVGKVHFDRSFILKWKKPEVFCKTLGRWITKSGRQVFSDLSAVCADIQLYGSSNPYWKGKLPFYIYEYATWNPGVWAAKKPDTSGFSRNISFLCSYYGGEQGIRLASRCTPWSVAVETVHRTVSLYRSYSNPVKIKRCRTSDIYCLISSIFMSKDYKKDVFGNFVYGFEPFN